MVSLRDMETVFIKPLSLNMAYRGRRFTTPELKAYKLHLAYVLPVIDVPKKGKLAVKYFFGVSSKNSDVDNLCKAIQDCLAEKYGFNDKQIYRIEMEKIDVQKGREYIAFEISKFT